RYPQGRADHGPAAAEENVCAAPDSQSDGHHGCDRLPARQAPEHQEQLGILRFHEYLRASLVPGAAVWTGSETTLPVRGEPGQIGHACPGTNHLRPCHWPVAEP